MGKAFGCAAIALIVAVIMLAVGVYLIGLSGDNARDAEIISGLTPALAAEVERAEQGRRVIVLGQIDPDTPLAEPSKGLALYERERYEVSRRRSGGSTRTSRSWKSDGGSTPSFRLLTDDGALQIVNSD